MRSLLREAKDVFRVLGMPCREHTLLLSRQLDEPLPRGVALGLRLHVVICQGCRRFRAQIARLRDAARSLGDELNTGPGIPAAAKDRVAAVLRQAAAQSRDGAE